MATQAAAAVYTTYPIPSGTRITLPLPDDFHHHFRDGEACTDVLGHASARFGRAIVMPNLKPPVTTTEMALTYRAHLLASLPPEDHGCSGSRLVPLMTLYLTDQTTPDEIRKAHATKRVYACKYYPMGSTTNSEAGVTDIRNIYPALRAMAECGLLLLIHSEVSGGPSCTVDIFDRESIFIETIIKPLVADMPTSLKIVLEHISTREAVEYVSHEDTPSNVAATITCHHLLYNRNDMLGRGGIRPHLYCLPILKRECHRLALLKAATSGNVKFFAGTDSAPHATSDKESTCGCAGIYTAHAAVELYVEAFESVNALDKLRGFLCHFGADYYGLERNTTTMITLEKKSWNVPSVYKFGTGVVRPLRAGETVAWSIVGVVSSS
jgi:dihydroorotase